MTTLGVVLVAIVVFGINISLVHSFYNVGVHYTISLDIYSGRDDPEWTIDFRDSDFDEIGWIVNSVPDTELDDDLGYSGFSILARNAVGENMWKSIGSNSNEELENLLLNSCNNNGLSRNVYNFVNNEINRNGNNNNNGGELKKRKRRQAVRGGNVCSTKFEPENWNFHPVQRLNNCYNYATNLQTNTFAQPGRWSGKKFSQLQANDVYAACLRDGCRRLFSENSGNDCLIALVIWPGEDYHFYRKDHDEFWSHKAGRTKARDTDDSGNKISDVLSADRGPYKVFAGWLAVGSNVMVK